LNPVSSVGLVVSWMEIEYFDSPLDQEMYFFFSACCGVSSFLVVQLPLSCQVVVYVFFVVVLRFLS